MIEMEKTCVLLLFILVQSLYVQGLTWYYYLNNEKFCENWEVGSELGTLNATSDSGAPVRYQILSTQFLDYADVNQDTGVLTYKGGFDRETQSSMNVQFQATSRSDIADTQMATAYIAIDDSNDNSPVFTPSTYVATITEYPWSNTDITTVFASDSDNSLAGSISFSIDGQGVVAVDQNNGEVTLISNVDYEESRYFIFDVYANNIQKGACDNFTINQVSNATIVLNIEDGPDQPPFFVGAPYFAEVTEGPFKGTSVYKVSARDLDYGLNWDMEYFITDAHGSENVFNIDKYTGEITLEQVIDRESIDNGIFLLEIMAVEVVPPDSNFSKDFCEFPFNATSSISITIIDVNDNLPTFYELLDPTDTSTKINQTQFNATIPEGTANFISVPNLYIYVQDTDSVENAQFKLSLIRGSEAFEVIPSTVNQEAFVQIRVKDSKSLDFETNPVMEIEIVAEESGSGTSTQHAFVTIYLTDVNDHSPKFESNLQASVFEDATNGTEIITINATDPDSGDFGEVFYTIPDDQMFEMKDNKSGIVTLVGELDRERRNVYFVTLAAIDGGGRSTSGSLEITVLDVNDNSPQFLRDSYTALLQENQTEFISPATLSARDEDEPNTPNSIITYQIVGGEFADHFMVEPRDTGQGVIVVAKPVDLEALPESAMNCDIGGGQINLTVMAIDQGNPPKNATTLVEISVEDFNDFTPEFPEMLYTATVKEKSDYYTHILQVNATDNDACIPNNLLDYQISSDDVAASNAFLIETTDQGGILRVKDSNLDLDVTPSYTVEVWAIDRGINRRTGTATIIVTLLDTNDKRPEFVGDSLKTRYVLENTTVGTELDNPVEATDTDSDSELEYDVVSVTCTRGSNLQTVEDNCTDRFKLNSISGFIKVNNSLDREWIDTFILQVTVKDLNANNIDFQTVSVLLTISIDDVNDNSPQFGSAILSVNEATSNAYVGQVQATDSDIGQNADITYAIAEESADYFRVESLTGQIYTNFTAIDREQIFNETGKNMFSVSVIAKDNGLQPRSTTETFDVTIVDINDNTPMFDESVLNATTISIKENEPVNTFVYQITAFDLDEGENARLKYSLVDSESRNNFNIDIDDGNLTTRTEFDRESRQSQQITVRAEDSATSSRWTETSLTVTIEDVDDNEPDFTSVPDPREVSAFVQEGPTPQNFFQVPMAADKDLPQNSVNSYYIVGGSGVDTFDIDRSSRNISAITELDREMLDEYDLIIWVTSDPNASPANTLTWNDARNNASMLHVIITVTDKNDNPPVFSSDNYEADMPIDTQPAESAVVFTLSATDQDIGANAELIYSLTQIVWVDSSETEYPGRFAVQPTTGNIYLAQQSDASGDGYYRVAAVASDGFFEATTTVTIRIIQADQTVVLFSLLTVEEFRAVEDDFIRLMKEMLNAEVFVDDVLPHVPLNEQDLAQSDIYMHARQSNSTELITQDEVITEINQNADFQREFGITGFKTDPEIGTNDITWLQAGLIIACGVFVVVIAIFGIATYCITKRYNQKLGVAKATEEAAKEVIDMKAKGQSDVLPGANKFAESGNPLFDDEFEGQMPSWPVNAESNDDDSIDDNAVDNQYSVPESEAKPPMAEEDKEDDNLENDFEIDFDAEKLGAALNRGNNNVFLFDDLDASDPNII